MHSTNNLLFLHCSWLNNWCVSDAVPSLLDKEALKKTQIIVSDDDLQLYGAFQSSISSHDSPYGVNARDRSCKWHKVSCECQMKFK